MHKKILKKSLMLILTLIITIGMQSVTFGITLPILDSLKTYKLVNTYVIRNTKNGDSGSLLNTKVTIILGTDLNSSYMINASAYKSSGGTITKDANGAYILTEIISSIAPNSSHSINVERTFTTGTIDYSIDKSEVTSNYSKLTNYTNYLRADSGIEVNDAGIQAKAKALTEDIVNPYDKSFAIFKFVNTSMTYNLSSQYANKGALSALTYKQGVCEDYAKLFVALCRASGIPSRTVVGYRNSGLPLINNNIDLTNASHMWAEVYLPGYGWIISEPTVIFNQKGISDDIFMRYFGKSLSPAEHIATSYKAGSYDSSITVSSNYNRTTNSKPTMGITSNAILQTKFPTLLDSSFLTTKDLTKVWNIKLNQVIDKKTATTDNISMKNSKGELIDFKVSSNENVVSISPIGKYKIGEQYVVYISDKVLSTEGTGIKNGYYFTFEIR
ncbi:transglutaminase-like domain-containing protein [Clostridium sp.]|uniref:transglutaminase-like domain-containing protein n=1 Tax=Clostridium sp. TaxID=1506 RepID=UPI003D6CBB16